MTPILIAAGSGVVGIFAGLLTLLTPVFRLHSRLDLNDYRLSQLEKEVREMHLEMKESLQQLTKPQKT